MRRSNLFVLIILGLSFSCTKREKPRTILSVWSEKTSSASVIQRKLASTENQCFNDIYTVQTLKEEAKELENKFLEAEEITGTWNHLNLADLPHPQALFLKLYGDKIGDLTNPNRFDYSSCTDLPCIINKVYGKDDSPNGYVHYIWFLKFGSMLAFDNDIYSRESKTPGTYEGRAYPFEKFLFKDAELFHIWRMSHLIRAPHSTLAYLKEIQRIPHDVEFKVNGVLICGLAYSGSVGVIHLSDCGLRTDGTSKRSLSWALLHELSHHVDSEKARGSSYTYSSYQKEYIDMAGFKAPQEYVWESILKTKWELKAGASAVSDYAKTSPVENFAESLSHFRVNAEEAYRMMIPDHFKYISDKFYNEKNFLTKSLVDSWILENASEINKGVLKSVISCGENPGNLQSSFFTMTDFASIVSSEMLNCIGSNIQDMSRDVRASISINEPEACETFAIDKSKVAWNESYRNYVIPQVEKYLNILQKDKNAVGLMSNLLGDVISANLAKDSYVACYGKFPEEDCYKEEFLIRVRNSANGFNLTSDAFLAMEELLLSQHSYEETKGRVFESYQQIVMGQTMRTRKTAAKLWAKCTAGPQNDDLPPTGKLFKIYGGYMMSSVYNCLNSNLPNAISEAMDQFSIAGYKLEDKKEEKIVSDFVLSKMTDTLLEMYEIQKKNEIKIAPDYYYNRPFYKPVGKVDLDGCIDNYVKQIKFEPLFNLKRELYEDMLKNSSHCALYVR